MSGLGKALETHTFYIRVGDQDMVAATDCVLFQLSKPMAGIPSLDLQPYDPGALKLAYGVRYISNLTFSTGEQSFDGTLPPLAKQKNPSQKAPAFQEKDSTGVSYNKRLPQVFTHQVSEIPSKGKAFSVFAQSVEGEDESYKFDASWPFHKKAMPTEEDTLNLLKPLCRPIVGGMSGGPIFMPNEDGSFSLIGLVSQALSVYLKRSGDSPEPHTLNIFQLITPELVDKINKIMARPEELAKPQ